MYSLQISGSDRQFVRNTSEFDRMENERIGGSSLRAACSCPNSAERRSATPYLPIVCIGALIAHQQEGFWVV
jgi:hypothetical protein